MKLIFFLILVFTSLFVSSPYAFANHISGQNDVFQWREHDLTSDEDVYCTFDGITPLGNRVSLQCEGNDFDGNTIDESGALYIIKVFDKADIRSGTLTNDITWTWDEDCSGAYCGMQWIAVLDGAYDYQSLSKPNGFPNNVDWLYNNNPPYMGISSSDMTALQGAAELGITGSGAGNNAMMACTQSNYITTEGSANTRTCSITNALWNESTKDQFTVILVINNDVANSIENEYISPVSLEITNTPVGTMTWNFPQTTDEANDWDSFLGSVYENNATSSDYGYFFSFDPSVPNPPTNLYATIATPTSIQLHWTAPIFTGLSPITGYKVERESPIGDGFVTILGSTGNATTTWTDTSVTAGQVYNYRVSAQNVYGVGAPSNESKDGTNTSTSTSSPQYSCNSTNDSFELFLASLSDNSVGLCWDHFNNQTDITRYEVNYTTPWGDPNVLVDTRLPPINSTLIGSLEPSTQYSFRVTAFLNAQNWNEENNTSSWDLTDTGSPRDAKFSSNGTLMYVPDGLNSKVSTYTLATPFDVQTATFDSDYYLPNATASLGGIAFKPDGTQMYEVNNDAYLLSIHDISNPWDLSTASESYAVDLATLEPSESNFYGIGINPDGTDVYLTGTGQDKIYDYSMSPAWDFTSMSLVESYDSITNPTGVVFTSDGNTMYTASLTGEVHEIALSSPYDLSTGTETNFVTLSNDNMYGGGINNADTEIYQGSYDTAQIITIDIPFTFQATDNSTNILNVTTTGANSFKMGNFTVNVGQNPLKAAFRSLDIVDIDNTTKRLDVEFLNTLSPSCNFQFRFAGTNQTYAITNSTTADASYDTTSFTFYNVTNDVINVKCYDTAADAEARTVITQNSFPLLQQIQNFRNGTYGTSGEFGNFDLITLIAIILAMIGFNRVAGHVGVLFVAIILGSLAVLQIIRWETVAFSIPVLILLVVVTIISHNRSDVAD